MAQSVKGSPSMHKAPSSVPSTMEADRPLQSQNSRDLSLSPRLAWATQWRQSQKSKVILGLIVSETLNKKEKKKRRKRRRYIQGETNCPFQAFIKY